MNTEVSKYQQVAALLNLEIMLLADSCKGNGLTVEDVQEGIAELEEKRIKITTDEIYRREQFALHGMLLNLPKA